MEPHQKSGCQDGNFTLRTLLHLRRQHNQDTYVIFANLVKAYDTYNHELMIKVLERYGAPPKFRESIRRLYTDLKVIVKIGKEKAEIDQQVGVRQGDNVSSVIFLFLMSAFAETLEKEWASSNISQTKFKNVTNMNEGQLTGQTRESMRRGINFVRNQILYIDDGAFPKMAWK